MTKYKHGNNNKQYSAAIVESNDYAKCWQSAQIIAMRS